MTEGTSAEYRATLMEEIYLAMRDTIAIPKDDRFATISEHKPENINNSGSYLDIDRSDDVIFIQITLNQGRSTDQKKALYSKIAERLSASLDVRPEDVVVSLIEVRPEDWSLGNGCLLYTSPSPRDATLSRMPSSA